LATNNVPLAILIGIIATTQNHLAKALERQGIEVFDQLRARIKRKGVKFKGDTKKPLIYTLGVVLNNTVFIYPIVAQRYAPPAVYTSMYAVGMIPLMIYASRVLGERITRHRALGAAAILVGTLVIGVENVLRSDYDRFDMAVTPTLVLVGAFLITGLVAIVLTTRKSSPHVLAVIFGVACGGFGGLDPFLKGVSQNMSGSPQWIPASSLSLTIFLSSFVIGFASFAFTQVGFTKRAPASVLIPIFNAVYILLPLLLQLALLPTFNLYWSTFVGVALILYGMALVRTLER
jgi:drug/metabolite transporter (DMT)-like permease